FRRVQNGGEGCDEHDLKQRCTDHHVSRYAQQVDHCGHHDESAAHTHDGAQQTDDHPDRDGRNGADVELRPVEAHLEGHLVHPDVLSRSLHTNWLAATGLVHRVDAFHQHQHADDAEECDVGECNEQFELANLPQELHRLDAEE